MYQQAKNSFCHGLSLLLKQEFVLHGDVLRKPVYFIIWEDFGAFYPDVFGWKTL